MNQKICSYWREALLSLLLILTPFIFTNAQESAHCTISGRWAEGECFAVHADGMIAFYANGGLLEIVDYAEPSNPIKLSDYVCNGRIEGVEMVGNHLFLVGGYNGFLKIIDVSDPMDPSEVGSLHLPEPNHIVISGDYGYISCQSKGLYIVDLSDLENPEVLSIIKTQGSAYRAVVKDSTVYLATEYYGFAVIGVADKSNPVIYHEVETEGACRGIDLMGDFLFLGCTDEGLLIYHHNWILIYIGTFDEGGHAEDVMIRDSIAYVANRYAGVYFLDVSDPFNPVKLGEMSTRRAAKIFVNEYYTVVADTWAFRILDVNDFENPVLIDEVEVANDLQGMAMQGNYIYTSNIYRGMHVVDIEDPSDPEKIAVLPHSGSHQDIFVQDTFAYIAGGSAGLLLTSVAEPANPWLISKFDFESSMNSVAAQGDYVYAGTYDEGMYIIDISAPLIPVQAGRFELEYEIVNIMVDGTLAYLCCEDNGLYIVDISDPATPFQVGHLTTASQINNIFLNGNTAYLAEGSLGLAIVDISDPTNPDRLMDYDTKNYLIDVWVEGHYAYLADRYDGLRIVDLTNQDAVEEVAFFETGNRAEHVQVKGEYIYVGDDLDGIYVLTFDSLSVSVEEVYAPGIERSQLIHSIYPNPSAGIVQIQLNPVNLGPRSVRILNSTGSIINSFKGVPEQDHLQWDGIDQGGDPVKSGIYFLEVSVDGKRQVQKLIII